MGRPSIALKREFGDDDFETPSVPSGAKLRTDGKEVIAKIE
jgi:hypothetical protein